MSSPAVRQLAVLSDLFAEALAYCQPESVAVFGIAGGNGLERLDGNLTKRVVGFDLNPLYLDAVRQRYTNLTGLELHCLDLAEQDIAAEPVQLVHAALVFEHAGVDRCLENAVSLVASGGFLSAVLQLPSESGQDVGPSPFSSIQNLRADFALIDPLSFRETLESRGFLLKREVHRSLPGGKGFWMGVFQAGKMVRAPQ